MYTYICGNIINNKNGRTLFFRKIYLSHLIRKGSKGLCVRGELETEQTATYWSQVPLTIEALLSHSAGLLNRGSWGPKPSAGSWFSLPRTTTRNPNNWLQLTRTLCGTGLYSCLTSTCFLWASHLHRIQSVHSQGYILISSIGCTCFLIDGWIEGQCVRKCLRYVYLGCISSLMQISLNIIDILCLHIFFWIRLWAIIRGGSITKLM